jgi:hypothetical protein
MARPRSTDGSTKRTWTGCVDERGTTIEHARLPATELRSATHSVWIRGIEAEYWAGLRPANAFLAHLVSEHGHALNVNTVTERPSIKGT